MSQNVTLNDMIRGHPKAPTPQQAEHTIERDQFIAARGELIEKGVKTEFWTGAILPAIEMLYEQYHQNRMAGDLEATGGEKFAEDLIRILGGYTDMAKKAIHRIAERQFGKASVLPFEGKKHD